MVYTVLILIIFISSIIIILLTPYLNLSSGYGEFEIKTSDCVNGLSYIDEVCVPNKETGKGCLRDGRITYNTYRTFKECDNYKVMLKWDEPEVSECIDGVQTISKKCIKVGREGINACIDSTSTGIVQYYSGDVHKTTRMCDDKQIKGQWIQLSPEYSYLPKNTLIPRGDIKRVENNEIYRISKYCNAELLDIGTYNNILACEYGDSIFIPSGETELCSGVKPDTTVNCRYLPDNYPYFLLSAGNSWIVVKHLPGNFGNNIPFVNAVSPGNFSYPDVELMLVELKSTDKCRLDDIIRQSAVGFIFIPLGDGRYKVGLNIAGSYPGVLVIKDHRLFWRQAKISNNSPGVDDGTIIELSIAEVNSLYSRIEFHTELSIRDVSTGNLSYISEWIGRKFSTNDLIEDKDCSIYVL